MNYHYKHIEYRLLFQYGWDRCPWFVDWKGLTDARRV